MNLKSKISRWPIFMALALLIGITACDDDNPAPEPTQNVIELASETGYLSILNEGISRFPDLASTLSGGEFTVLAPNDIAFANLLEAVGQTSLDDIPDEVLRNILSYHVIPNQTITAEQLSNTTLGTVSGEDVTVSIDGEVTFNGSASVINADIFATNGVVHVIDEVLINPSIQPIVGTVVAPAYFNKDFTTLIAAVEAASPNILATLLNNDTKTIFAPTNEAFIQAGIDMLPDQATLNAVLTYHVLGQEVRAADIADGSSEATTLNGDIYLSNTADGVFINGTTEVTATDIDANNGVVHVINRTLLPPSQTIADIAIDASESEQPEFTQLVAALSKVSSLLDAASSDGDLTVFAPTDAAFQALYDELAVNNIDELEAAIGNDGLAEVLQHHIVGDRVFSTDLSNGEVPTLNQNVTIDLNNLEVSPAEANASEAGLITDMLNIHATNGVIHVIDAVLIPEGIL